MRFFTIFLLVAMALAQGETESTAAAVVTTVPIPAETTVPVDDGNSTEVSWIFELTFFRLHCIAVNVTRLFIPRVKSSNVEPITVHHQVSQSFAV